MATAIFANRAQSTLASALTSVATTATLAPGTGVLYPAPTGAQYFVLTFSDAATGLVTEVVWVTNRTGDTLTLLRGQETTSAKSWLVGDLAACYPTAGTQSSFVQPDQLQQGVYGYTVAAGTANALSGAIASNLTSLPDGLSITVKALAGNTSVVTFSLNLGASGAFTYPIVKGNNSPLVAGDIPTAGYQIQLNWSALFNAYIMQNPATGVSTIPPGSLFNFPCVSPPTGFLLCNGQLISRTTYAALYAFAAASGNIVADSGWNSPNFSSGDGSTTFRLPQYGGYFLRTLDNGNGIDPGRTIGQVQGNQIASHTHTAVSGTTATSTSAISGLTATTTITDHGHTHPPGAGDQYVVKSYTGGLTSNLAGASGVDYFGEATATGAAFTGISAATTISGGIYTATSASTSTTISNTGGSETRPINVSVLTCIKY